MAECSDENHRRHPRRDLPSPEVAGGERRTDHKGLDLRGVKEVLKTTRRKAGRKVALPIVRSKRPGSVELDNARIYEIVSFP